MKKTTIFGILCMICTLSFGQILNAPKLNQQHRIASMKSSFQNQASIAANPSKLPLSIVAALFSENFEGVTAPALPSGWTTTGNAGSDKFKTGTNTTAGSTYFPVTAHTKFVFSNDDNCNCDKSNDILNFPTLDFTGKTGLTLRFESYMSIPPYLDNDSAFVEISTDGGTTYTIIYRLPKTNSWTVNSVDLNAYNNLPDVRLRFRYIDDVEATATWAYGVAIDDIVVDLPPNNDLFISKTYFGTDPANNTIPDSTLSSYYSSIPSCQSNADTLTFWATTTNSGAVSQPNVILDINVTGAGTFSGSSAATSVLAPGNSVDLMSTTDFTPQAIGTYDINFTVSSDSIEATPTNNTIIRSFNVTDTVYARDDDNFSSGTLYDNFGTMYILGNLFEVNVQDTATSISMYVGAYGNPIYNPTGKSISLDLYDMGVDPAVVLAQEFYSITAGDLGTWITRPLPGGVSLPPGIYLAAYQMYTDTFLIVKSDLEAPPLASLYSTDNAATWSYVPYVPFVRLNLKGCTPSCLMTSSATSTSAICGGNNGTATVTAAGGTPPYTYLWNDPAPAQTTATATGLAAGSYSVTVTDGSACTSIAGVSVTTGTSDLAISNVTSGNDTCSSGTGTATVTATGTQTPFTYLWSSGATGSSVSGLTAGSQSVTVTDSKGCTATNSVTVSNISTGLTISSITSVNATSCTAADGSASATVTGGQAPFTYLWSNSQTTTTATGLVSAPYGFLVTDKYGCSDSGAVVVGAVGAPQVSATITGTIACNGGNTGSASVTVIGGTTPYTYAWSTSPIQTDSTATGLTADLYIVTVTDAGSCNAYAQVTITEPTALSTINGSTDVTCFGANNGTAGIVVSGGTGAYTYSWNTTPPQTGPDATGLAAGSFKVVFNDANGCSDSVSFTVTEPTALTAAASATDVLCNGNSTGSATATVSGGVSPYAYSWTGGQTTSAATGLTPGAYTVAVTDSNGCTANASATLTEPAALAVVLDNTTATRIFITVSGGVAPYGYMWSNGSTAEDPVIAGSGTYNVTVTDINACTTTFTVTGISENNVNVSFTLIPNPAKEMFVLAMKNMKKDTYSIELRNILGQAILSESVEISGNFTRKFNVSKLNKGVYFLKVKNSQGERTEKVVKY